MFLKPACYIIVCFSGHKHKKSIEKLRKIEQYGENGDVPPVMSKLGV